MPGEGVYLREDRTGKTAGIGRFDPSLPGMENRMRLQAGGFAELGLPVLEKWLREGEKWVCIDEIGYLESGCPGYCEAIRRLMDHEHLLAAVRKQEVPFLLELLGREDVFRVDLDAPFGNLGCVIMASGLGRRFGGNKLMADFYGEPLICRALDATEGIFSRRVVVTRHPEVEALCRDRNVPVLLHELPLRSDTVRLGTQAVGDRDGCLFCPGDQPLLRRETVASLALCAVNGKSFIWRTAFGDTPGAPVLFPRWTFPELLTLPPGQGGGFLIKKYPGQVRSVPVRDARELMDADSPEDLSALQER